MPRVWHTLPTIATYSSKKHSINLPIIPCSLRNLKILFIINKYYPVGCHTILKTPLFSFTRKPTKISITDPPECLGTGIRLVRETIHCNVKALPKPDTYFWHLQPANFEVQHLTTGSASLPLDQITGPMAETLKASCEASNGIASQEEQCEKTFSFEHLRPPQPHQCDIAYEFGEFQMRCIPGKHTFLFFWEFITLDHSNQIMHYVAGQ